MMDIKSGVNKIVHIGKKFHYFCRVLASPVNPIFKKMVIYFIKFFITDSESEDL